MDRWKKWMAGLVALAAGVVYASHSHAAAPPAKTQAPGFYRMTLGDFEVTAVSDGVIALPVAQLLTNTTPQRVAQLLKQAYLEDPVPTSVNAFVVNTGSKLVMIDSGAGTLFGPTVGKFVENLKAAGYQPEQVDEIYITHMHGDHVGGLASGDKLVFPNAVVRADRRDADFWLSQAKMDAAKRDDKNAFKGAMVSLNPYVAAGKFKPFDGPTELVPGIRAISTYGHTPGHTIYLVESKGQAMAMLGDLMHVAAVQFANPAVTIKFDTDSRSAAAARKRIYADAAAKGWWIAVAHVSFPGIGHIRKEGAVYAYVPVNYSIP
jgi:glyoxylase-like metal-dependent hydrolase (beta-lactamase superfamily II)